MLQQLLELQALPALTGEWPSYGQGGIPIKHPLKTGKDTVLLAHDLGHLFGKQTSRWSGGGTSLPRC